MRLLLILLTICFLGSFSVVIAQTAEELIEMAEEEAKEQKYDKSAELLEKAIQLEPRNLDYRLDYVVMLYNMEKIEEAIVELDAVFLLDKKYIDAYITLANMQEKSAKFKDAIVTYTKALEQTETDSIRLILFIRRAHVHIQSPNPKLQELALEDFQKAYKLDSTNTMVLEGLSRSYERKQDYTKAIFFNKKSLAIDSTHHTTNNNMGLLYLMADSLDKAKYFLNKSIDINNSKGEQRRNAFAYNNLAFVYYEKKQYAKAIQLVNQSLKINTYNSYAYRNRALIYLAKDQKQKACKDLSTAQRYRFRDYYGDEVDQLYNEHCRD